jgi:hypothetical protein
MPVDGRKTAVAAPICKEDLPVEITIAPARAFAGEGAFFTVVGAVRVGANLRAGFALLTADTPTNKPRSSYTTVSPPVPHTFSSNNTSTSTSTSTSSNGGNGRCSMAAARPPSPGRHEARASFRTAPGRRWDRALPPGATLREGADRDIDSFERHVAVLVLANRTALLGTAGAAPAECRCVRCEGDGSGLEAVFVKLMSRWAQTVLVAATMPCLERPCGLDHRASLPRGAGGHLGQCRAAIAALDVHGLLIVATGARRRLPVVHTAGDATVASTHS